MRYAYPRRPWLAWVLTLVAAAGLLALGYWLGREVEDPRLAQLGEQLAAQTTRAERLAAQNQSLEQRLARLEAERVAPAEAPPKDKPAGEAEVSSHTLTRGRAVVLLGGKLVVSLLEVGGKPRQAAFNVKVLGGQEGTAVLKPGSSVGIKVDGAVYYLVLKAVHTSSVSFSLVAKSD